MGTMGKYEMWFLISFFLTISCCQVSKYYFQSKTESCQGSK